MAIESTQHRYVSSVKLWMLSKVVLKIFLNHALSACMSLNTTEAVYKLKNIQKHLLTKTSLLILEEMTCWVYTTYPKIHSWNLNLVKENCVRFDDTTAENVDNIWKFFCVTILSTWPNPWPKFDHGLGWSLFQLFAHFFKLLLKIFGVTLKKLLVKVHWKHDWEFPWKKQLASNSEMGRKWSILTGVKTQLHISREANLNITERAND